MTEEAKDAKTAESDEEECRDFTMNPRRGTRNRKNTEKYGFGYYIFGNHFLSRTASWEGKGQLGG